MGLFSLWSTVNNVDAGWEQKNIIHALYYVPCRCVATLPSCLAFPGKQPFNTFRKLMADSKQDLRPYLDFAVFHGREIVLANANTLGKLLLRHVKAANLPDAAAYAFPVN